MNERQLLAHYGTEARLANDVLKKMTVEDYTLWWCAISASWSSDEVHRNESLRITQLRKINNRIAAQRSRDRRAEELRELRNGYVEAIARIDTLTRQVQTHQEMIHSLIAFQWPYYPELPLLPEPVPPAQVST